MRDLLFDLGLKFVGGAAEFVHPLADLASDLRQLLRSKDNQGQKKQENRLGKTHAIHHTAPAANAAIEPGLAKVKDMSASAGLVGTCLVFSAHRELLPAGVVAIAASRQSRLLLARKWLQALKIFDDPRQDRGHPGREQPAQPALPGNRRAGTVVRTAFGDLSG